MTRLLGIDPGSNITGYGVISLEGNTITRIDSGCLRLQGKSLQAKLYEISKDISSVIERHSVTEVAIESVFMHTNANVAIKLGHARGAAIVGLANTACKLYEYTPREVKKAVTGYGAASKEQMQGMIQRLLDIHEKIQVDEADALAIAICHANSRNMRKIIDKHYAAKREKV